MIRIKEMDFYAIVRRLHSQEYQDIYNHPHASAVSFPVPNIVDIIRSTTDSDTHLMKYDIITFAKTPDPVTGFYRWRLVQEITLVPE